MHFTNTQYYLEGSVYFAECGLRNAEFRSRIFCGNFHAECSANYTLFEFRNPHSAKYCFTICKAKRDRQAELNVTVCAQISPMYSLSL